MICSFCGNVTENKRAVGLYMRAARITHIDCPEYGRGAFHSDGQQRERRDGRDTDKS